MTRYESRITSLTSNAGTFPLPNPSVPVLTQAKNNLDARLKAISQMESNLEAERAAAVTAEAELDAYLEQEASYVEKVANRRSAEWRSAVSRIGNPQRLASSDGHRPCQTLPNAIRRNSRLPICAASVERQLPFSGDDD